MSVPVPLPRVEAFEKLGFGMFVHWGLYSLVGRGEWAPLLHKIPFEEYQKLAADFTASDFNAEELAKTAREAGMKYIVLTARHCEGFSLYDTCGLNEFDAPHSAAGRDLVAEFVTACRKYEIIPFFYHATIDWHWEGKTTASLSAEDFERYLEYLHASIELLCKNYGKIGGFWLDGNWDRPGDDWKEDRLYGMIRKYQPDAMIVNNTGLWQQGQIGHPEIDSVTYEQGCATWIDREGQPKYVAGEVCRTMNSHWGIGTQDFSYASPREMIELLAQCRSFRANLLLNIGPSGQGGIPAYERETLKIIGKWCALYREAIYSPVPVREIRCPGRDFVLKEGKHYYYFAHDLVVRGSENVIKTNGIAGGRTLEHFPEEVVSAYWMEDGQPVEFLRNAAAGSLTVDCSGFPYGSNTVVRVMKITVR